MNYCIVIVTCANEADSTTLASDMVKQKLAAPVTRGLKLVPDSDKMSSRILSQVFTIVYQPQLFIRYGILGYMQNQAVYDPVFGKGKGFHFYLRHMACPDKSDILVQHLALDPKGAGPWVCPQPGLQEFQGQPGAGSPGRQGDTGSQPCQT